MASKSIAYFTKFFRTDSPKELREVARNKEKMYAVNAVKSAKRELLRRNLKL